MTGLTAFAAAAAGGAVWCAQQPSTRPLSRLGPGRLQGAAPTARVRSPQRSSEPGPVTRRLACAAAAFSTVLVVPGPAGWLVAVGVAVVADRWLSHLTWRSERAVDASVRRQLPLALTLMGAALGSGATVPAAVGLAARGSGAEVRKLLLEVEASLALGAQPGEAWSPVLRQPSARPLGRLAVRSASSGAAMAQACRDLSAQLRAGLQVDAQVAVKRAGVLSVLPLTLCFLPAFALVGVVPVVLGLLRTLSI